MTALTDALTICNGCDAEPMLDNPQGYGANCLAAGPVGPLTEADRCPVCHAAAVPMERQGNPCDCADRRPTPGGLRVEIARTSYDCDLNLFHGKRAVVLVNVPGRSYASEAEPAARLERGPGGDMVVVPDAQPANMAGPMYGGTYAGGYGMPTGRAALPVHDRFETWEQHELMSR